MASHWLPNGVPMASWPPAASQGAVRDGKPTQVEADALDGTHFVMVAAHTIAGSQKTDAGVMTGLPEKHKIPGNNHESQEKFKQECLSAVLDVGKRAEEHSLEQQQQARLAGRAAAPQGNVVVVMGGDMNLLPTGVKQTLERNFTNDGHDWKFIGISDKIAAKDPKSKKGPPPT